MLTHKGTQSLQTARLVLRPFMAEDAEDMYHNWASDPEVTKYLTWPSHSSLEVSRRILEDWVEANAQIDRYHWMIVLKELGQPIGSITVVEHRDDIGEAEVGYCIGKQWWHKGLVTEAMRAVMGYLFEQVGMNRVEARHDPNNPHSGGVMKKCGMHYEGTLRSADRNNQGICDTAVYGMLKEEWK